MWFFFIRSVVVIIVVGAKSNLSKHENGVNVKI